MIVQQSLEAPALQTARAATRGAKAEESEQGFEALMALLVSGHVPANPLPPPAAVAGGGEGGEAVSPPHEAELSFLSQLGRGAQPSPEGQPQPVVPIVGDLSEQPLPPQLLAIQLERGRFGDRGPEAGHHGVLLPIEGLPADSAEQVQPVSSAPPTQPRFDSAAAESEAGATPEAPLLLPTAASLEMRQSAEVRQPGTEGVLVVAPAPLEQTAAREGVQTSSPVPVEEYLPPDRVMELIARTVQQGRQREGGGPASYGLSLRLYPEELGTLEVSIRVTGKDVVTSFQVTNPAAMTVLSSHSESLRQALNQAGLSLTGFQVGADAGQKHEGRGRDLQDQGAQTRRQQSRSAAAKAAGAAGWTSGFVTAAGRSGRLDTLA